MTYTLIDSIFFEKWVNFEIIVGIQLLIKAIILCIQNIVEVLLEDCWNKNQLSSTN